MKIFGGYWFGTSNLTSGSTNQEALWLNQSGWTLAQPIRRHSGSTNLRKVVHLQLTACYLLKSLTTSTQHVTKHVTQHVTKNVNQHFNMNIIHHVNQHITFRKLSKVTKFDTKYVTKQDSKQIYCKCYAQSVLQLKFSLLSKQLNSVCESQNAILNVNLPY